MSHCYVLILVLSWGKKRLSLIFVKHNKMYTIQITIVDRLIYFHWDMYSMLKLNIHNIESQNIKEEGTKYIINCSTTQ